MARFEQDREDILREATALVERVELWAPNQLDPTVAGFRRDGSASFFFGVEPVLQFNVNGELRRAYDDGRLLKAVHGRLIAMQRVRNEQEVSLISQELTAEETGAFCERMLQLLATLRDALRRGTARIGRQVPPEAGVVEHVQSWLETLGDHLTIADRPNVGGAESRQR